MRTQALLLAIIAALAACSGSRPPPAPEITRLRTDRSHLRDGQGRYVLFHGINVSGASKLPASVDAQGIPSFVGRPFPLSTAREHFGRLREMGFDSVRLVLQWEGIEPAAKGRYDQAYLEYIREIVLIAGEFRIRVLLDMHQDFFSRHLLVKFNNHPRGAKGSLESNLFAFLPPYDDTVQGDGAPKWAVQACLPEKKIDSPNWGVPRVLSGLDEAALLDLYNLIKRINDTAGEGGGGGSGTPPWLVDFLNQKPAPFPANETTDLLPLTNGAPALSIDVARVYACFFAGAEVFPGLKAKDGRSVEDWLQDAYAKAFAQVAAYVYDLPNVMGYDLMNEPSTNMLPLAVAALYTRDGPEAVQNFLTNFVGAEMADQLWRVLVGMRLLPPDTTPATLQAWGLDGVDVPAALALLDAFEELHMRPFYERVGRAILEVDPEAVVFVENGLGTGAFYGSPYGGVSNRWERPMERPDLPQVVYAPHYYADIYPFMGINQPPRTLSASEVRYRDYGPAIDHAKSLATYSMGNVPTIFGEFGTFFSFNGIWQARAEEYLPSASILDNYYEALEQRFNVGMLWCYTPDNTFVRGDGWNHEDFSIIDQNEAWRGELAWSRPHARAVAGKPLSTHFYSDYHYFDPDKGEVPMQHEFEITYESRETSAPTEIVVPKVQYPNGFYVWVSDGHCYFDPETRTLFHYPSADSPGFVHSVRLLPPLPGHEAKGWKYFIREEQVVERN